MDFLSREKKKKKMQGIFQTMLKPYLLTLGFTLTQKACPKTLASPTLYSQPQLGLWAAFQPRYTTGFPQLEVAACPGRAPGCWEMDAVVPPSLMSRLAPGASAILAVSSSLGTTSRS